jgi:glycosyltransferase involved in cell wall biosynthesis
VFDLDQFFMRSTHRRVRRLADDIIRDFCRRFKEFDFVNIQLEHGTLGQLRQDIERRFSMIARAAPALSVTFHTIEQPSDIASAVSQLRRLKVLSALSTISNHFMNERLYRLLRRLQRSKSVNIIVHTRRDMRLMRYIHRLKNVQHHPLAFLSSELAERIRHSTSSNDVPGLRQLPPNVELVGFFGFLSEYKGLDTVIKAMHTLPEKFHLLIFGGLHPNEIKKGVKLNSYIDQILKEANVGVTVAEKLAPTSVVLQVGPESGEFITGHPKDIGHRIHFLGAQTDESFARYMGICDHVVLPYLEVGQSSSGVLSIAVEMGARVIAARNHAFLQFSKYHPNRIEMFEVGNFLELAERIQAPAAYLQKTPSNFTTETNAQVYVHANTLHATSPAPAVQPFERI